MYIKYLSRFTYTLCLLLVIKGIFLISSHHLNQGICMILLCWYLAMTTSSADDLARREKIGKATWFHIFCAAIGVCCAFALLFAPDKSTPGLLLLIGACMLPVIGICVEIVAMVVFGRRR